MAKNYQYTSVDRIFSKLDRDITSDFNEDYIIEWIGEALEFMEAPNQLEQCVAFIEVKSFQCSVPKYARNILQIARDNKYCAETKKECTPQNIINEIPNVAYQKCSNCGDNDMGYVVLDGMGTPVLEYDIAYYRPYFDLKAERLEWNNSNYYIGRYTPVRKATSSFFGTNVDEYESYNCNELHGFADDKYTIINGEVLRFSFESGFVAVAFERQVMDDKTGYPMIPDNISYTSAIIWYITKQITTKKFYRGEQGSDGRLKFAEDQWDWYCGQAKNVDKMPFGIDDYQNIGDMRNRLIPINSYNNFFGNLANPEYRKFNDPDYRNIKSRYTIR